MKMQAVTVSQLNFYIKSLLDGDAGLHQLFVVGELSNFTNHYKSGHFYFSLKDQKSVIKCVMFAGYASRVRFHPQDGMRVLVRGRVSVYEASGQYQLYVEDMQPDGVGDLSLAFEQLKKKLEQEGLFRKERKKMLPPYPKKIGVITSPTGAAIRDIEHILCRRYPIAQVVVCPVLVQGEEAPAQIMSAIRRFNALSAADVLIVGRGGGSMEDLWAFNDEGVARAIADSSIPIISAVGHETDFTICDFVADLRAPTPSAAAELAVPDQADLLVDLRVVLRRLQRSMDAMIKYEKTRLMGALQSSCMRNPQELVENRRQRLDALSQALLQAFSRKLSSEQTKFGELSAKLHTLSPLQVLSRGYAIAQTVQGDVVKSINQAEPGQNLFIKLSDGRLDCMVKSTRKEKIDEENVF